jgi:hypothetical protein
LIYLLKIVIFHRYVSSPEGTQKTTVDGQAILHPKKHCKSWEGSMNFLSEFSQPPASPSLTPGDQGGSSPSLGWQLPWMGQPVGFLHPKIYEKLGFRSSVSMEKMASTSQSLKFIPGEHAMFIILTRNYAWLFPMIIVNYSLQMIFSNPSNIL